MPALTDEAKSRNAKSLDRRRPVGVINAVSHLLQGPTNVCCYSKSDQKWCVAANDAKCQSRTFNQHFFTGLGPQQTLADPIAPKPKHACNFRYRTVNEAAKKALYYLLTHYLLCLRKRHTRQFSTMSD